MNEIQVVEIKVVEKTSKKGNNYKCVVAVDENGKEHFLAFTN